jgi:hypothetical protein
MVARRRSRSERPIPEHPYRGTAVLYAVLAVLLVAAAAATGGAILKAIGAAAAFFLVATAWSWWRFRERIRRSEGS